MFQIMKNVNAYVEEQSAYKSDNVLLTCNESTFTVTAVPCDENGVALVGVNPIVNNAEVDLPTAIKSYLAIEAELSQGDVIRNPQTLSTI